SPLALPSPLAAGIVSVKSPAGRMILLLPPLASAAMMADRSETWPLASWPVFRFTATVSRNVLTRKVAGVTRPSSASSPGRSPRRLAFPLRDENLSMVHLSDDERAPRPTGKSGAIPNSVRAAPTIEDRRVRRDVRRSRDHPPPGRVAD